MRLVREQSLLEGPLPVYYRGKEKCEAFAMGDYFVFLLTRKKAHLMFAKNKLESVNLLQLRKTKDKPSAEPMHG